MKWIKINRAEKIPMIRSMGIYIVTNGKEICVIDSKCPMGKRLCGSNFSSFNDGRTLYYLKLPELPPYDNGKKDIE